MLVEVEWGEVVAFDVVDVKDGVPLLFSLHGCPTPHIKWLQVSICDVDLIRGPLLMEEDSSWCLGVIVFVSVRLSLHVTCLPTCFWNLASLGLDDSCKLLLFILVIGIFCQVTAILLLLRPGFSRFSVKYIFDDILCVTDIFS